MIIYKKRYSGSSDRLNVGPTRSGVFKRFLILLYFIQVKIFTLKTVNILLA